MHLDNAFPGSIFFSKCVGFSEIKPAAIACYRDNFPDAPALGAAETATWPAADLVCAGFPCQPFSRCQKVFEVDATAAPSSPPVLGSILDDEAA